LKVNKIDGGIVAFHVQYFETPSLEASNDRTLELVLLYGMGQI